MPTQDSLEQIEIGELIVSVDDGRAAGDAFKLGTALRALLVARLADAKTKDAATFITAAGRAGASLALRTALDTLKGHVRDGYNFVKGLGSYQITAADRLTVYTSYGWESGEVGDFTDARVESLANQAIPGQHS